MHGHLIRTTRGFSLITHSAFHARTYERQVLFFKQSRCNDRALIWAASEATTLPHPDPLQIILSAKNVTRKKHPIILIEQEYNIIGLEPK